MALKIDAKFGGKLTGAFKIDMSNLANIHRLKKSDFILEIKMAELNKKKKKIQNKQINQMQFENFILENFT